MTNDSYLYHHVMATLFVTAPIGEKRVTRRVRLFAFDALIQLWPSKEEREEKEKSPVQRERERLRKRRRGPLALLKRVFSFLSAAFIAI